jgi:hypothetical protein
MEAHHAYGGFGVLKSSNKSLLVLRPEKFL